MSKTSIKQEIPKGWVASYLSKKEIEHTTIPHKAIVTNWLWRNRHAEPITTVIIPNQPNLIFRDACIARYNRQIKTG